MRRIGSCAFALLVMAAGAAWAGDIVADEAANAKFQSTYVWQTRPSFAAAYSGPNSLRTEHEKGYSFSATAAFGWRLWHGAQLYFDPEVVQGVPLSNLTGLGGLSNGEQQKTGGPNPTFYRARLFVRQRWDLGGEQVAVESGANQLAGMQSVRRVVLTVGNLAIADLFDANGLSHDPRSQFLNWALTANGAWDFAADARGYTWGAALEYIDDDWALRAGRFLQPAESNGLPLDHRIFRHYGDQIEVTHNHTLAGRPGVLRLLAFHNRASMGGFQDALDLATASGSVPAVAQVRRERSKHGVGVNVEQAITQSLGVFGRAGWNDGASETYSFAEIERSLSGGVVIKGHGWGRPDDTFGVALVRNGLSPVHRAYLAAGGLGAFIGDGALT
ncbi:high affinity Mn2+ porin [Actimicrobium sp. GrIS 1.19]|nr:high affinity Mn2+ porin [Actimicrobium sp. GrIS 1.19]